MYSIKPFHAFDLSSPYIRDAGLQRVNLKFIAFLALCSLLLASLRPLMENVDFCQPGMPKCLQATPHRLSPSSSSKLFEVRERVTAAYRIPVSSIQQVPPWYDRLNRADASLDVSWKFRGIARGIRSSPLARACPAFRSLIGLVALSLDCTAARAADRRSKWEINLLEISPINSIFERTVENRKR